MRPTLAASYAIHAVAFLAAQDGGRPVASHVIAQARGIPERFLLKVLKQLVTARVLLSLRGPSGGFRFARSPKEISLLDVVEAVEGPIPGRAPSTPRGDGDCPRRLA